MSRIEAIYCDPSSGAPWFLKGAIAGHENCCVCVPEPPPPPPEPCGSCWDQPGNMISDRFESIGPGWTASPPCEELSDVCSWDADGVLFLDVPGWLQTNATLTHNITPTTDWVVETRLVSLSHGVGFGRVTLEVRGNGAPWAGIRFQLNGAANQADISVGMATGWHNLGWYPWPVSVRWSCSDALGMCTAINGVEVVTGMTRPSGLGNAFTITLSGNEWFAQGRVLELDEVCVRNLLAGGAEVLSARVRTWLELVAG